MRRDVANPERAQTWICNCCGEVFSSLEDYQSKLKGENDWAQTWIEWAEARQLPDTQEESVVIEEASEEALVETEGQEAFSETVSMP